MTLTRYLLTMILATLVSAGSWWLVILFLDPQSSGTVGVALFFGSLFLAVFGVSSVLGFAVRRVSQRQETSFKIVAISFRQAALFAVLLTGSLLLQAARALTLWTGFLLLVIVILVEAFFMARATGRRQQRGGSHGT